jgi:hypothetical protein
LSGKKDAFQYVPLLMRLYFVLTGMKKTTGEKISFSLGILKPPEQAICFLIS